MNTVTENMTTPNSEQNKQKLETSLGFDEEITNGSNINTGATKTVPSNIPTKHKQSENKGKNDTQMDKENTAKKPEMDQTNLHASDVGSKKKPAKCNNPYAKSTCENETRKRAANDFVEILQHKEHDVCCPKSKKEKNMKPQENMCTPAKRNMHSLNIMNTSSNKRVVTSKNTDEVRMLVQGYAFEDHIVGVAHRQNNGEEAFNIVLRNMVFNKELENEGFSAYVGLRDKTSGKEDRVLTNDDGYPKFLFMSINVHHFDNIQEA